MSWTFYKERAYKQCTPIPDNNEWMIERMDRLILYHTENGPEILVAKKGVQHAGWVIGYFEEE